MDHTSDEGYRQRGNATAVFPGTRVPESQLIHHNHPEWLQRCSIHRPGAMPGSYQAEYRTEHTPMATKFTVHCNVCYHSELTRKPVGKTEANRLAVSHMNAYQHGTFILPVVKAS